MAIGDPYATVTDLEKRLGKTDDGTFEMFLRSASQAIELWCGRQFNQATTATARRFRAVDGFRLPTDDFHTTDGLAVDVDGQTWTPEQVDPRPWDGVYNGQSGWPYFDLFAVGRTWPCRATARRAVVTVTAQWGWPAVPDSIHNATLILARRYYQRSDAWAFTSPGNPRTRRRLSESERAEVVDTDMARIYEQDPDVAFTLELYRVRDIAGV